MHTVAQVGFVIVVLGVLGASAGAFADEPVFPPGSPPADQLHVVDLIEEPSDSVRLMVTTLQGLVNRGDRASLYILVRESDRFWLEYMIEHEYIEGYAPMTVDECLEHYGHVAKSGILYDPELPATMNLATMIAAIDDGIVVHPDDAHRLGDRPVEDLRGRWTTNADAYTWAFDELWPRMNQTVLAAYHPTSIGHHLRDYLVRNRIFHFWVTSEEQADGVTSDFEAEKAVLETILEGTPVNIPVIGFWFSGQDHGIHEYTGVGLAGEFGKFTVVCDWSANLSVISGIPADLDAAIALYHDRPEPPMPEFDPDKVYIVYHVLESGDAPVYLHYVQYDVWKDPKRREIPINWCMGPGAFDLMPMIAAYYYDEATPQDYIYMAISGAGYVHPYRDFLTRTPDPESAWQEYLGLTARYFDRMGASAIGLYTDAFFPFNRDEKDLITRRFADGVPGVRSLILGMGRDDGMNAVNGNYRIGDDDVQVNHILTRWPVEHRDMTKEENLQWLVDDIRSNTPDTRPAFMHVMAYSWEYRLSDIVEVHERLGEEYVALTIPQFQMVFDAHGPTEP